MPDPARIAERVAAVRTEIMAACAAAGRDPTRVTLVAVTKSQGAAVLTALRSAGVRDFGENRVDHLVEMQRSSVPGDRWHYIGRIQSRQLTRIAPVVDALHSLCELSHVERLARACIQAGRRLPVYLQVNVSGEAAKAGIVPEALAELLAAVRAQPALIPAGLMTMAPELDLHADAGQIRSYFAALRRLAEAHGLDGLSMGMSGDFHLAVAEGATVVRVGSRLFAD